MAITGSQIDDASLVRLEGVIDISVAAELKDALGRAIAESRPVRIAAEGVTGLDVTAFQLLQAAQREARQKVSFAGNLPEPVRSFLESVGLVDWSAPERSGNGDRE